MIDEKNKMLGEFLVEAKDRTYQIWERNSLSIDLWTEKVFIQKLNYIHNNFAEEYLYSSGSPHLRGIFPLRMSPATELNEIATQRCGILAT